MKTNVLSDWGWKRNDTHDAKAREAFESVIHVSAHIVKTKNVSEYDQEIPQSQTADKPMAPRGRTTQQSQDTRKTN